MLILDSDLAAARTRGCGGERDGGREQGCHRYGISTHITSCNIVLARRRSRRRSRRRRGEVSSCSTVLLVTVVQQLTLAMRWQARGARGHVKSRFTLGTPVGSS